MRFGIVRSSELASDGDLTAKHWLDKPKCRVCGTQHDPHEDAACGCGCGSEPMGCAQCMRDGGPAQTSKASYEDLYDSRDMDEVEDF